MVGVTKAAGSRRSSVFQVRPEGSKGEANVEERNGSAGAGDWAGDEPRKKEETAEAATSALLFIPRNGSINEIAGQTKPNAARSRAIHALRGPRHRVYR